MQTKLTQKEQEQDYHQGTEQQTLTQDKVRLIQYIYTGGWLEEVETNRNTSGGVKLNIMYTK